MSALTRKRSSGVLARNFALLGLAVGLSACGPRETPADRAARDGVLLQSLGVQNVELDPHLATLLSDAAVVRALFEGLVTPDPRSLEPRPGVAERWDVSRDGLEYTFFLRPNARWSNGDALTAEDFVASIRRALTPELAAPNASLMYVLRGARAFHRGETTDFSQVGVAAIDARTLRFTLQAPAPHFLSLLTHFVWLPVDVPSIRAVGSETSRTTRWTLPERLVGNGPFRLAQLRPQQFVELVANPAYWDANNVGLRGVTFFASSSVDGEERAFRAGQLHVTDALPIAKIRTYREQESALLRVAPSFAVYFYRFNVTRPPFNDPRVRRALSLAIDRERLTQELLAGAHAPALTFTPPGVANYPAPDPITEDAELARRLLAEAGFARGEGMRHVEILFNKSENHQLIAEAIQEMWRRELGLNVTLANQEYGVFLDNRRQLNFDVCRASWFGDYLDPLTFLELLTSGNANNQTGWSNVEFDRLVAEATRTADAARRLVLLSEAEKILLQEMPVIPLYVQSTIRLVDPRVQGWFDNPLDVHPHKAVSFTPNPTVPPSTP